MIQGNLALFESTELRDLARQLDQARGVVAQLLDKDEEVKDRLEEIDLWEDPMDRIEGAANLYDECTVFVASCKEMENALKRAKKRVDKVQASLETALITEVDPFEDGKVETANHALAIRKKPAKVLVTELAKVPKKYRLEPKPLPSWEQWDVDKNHVKTALTKERVKSIPGVELDEGGRRIEVKAR